MGIGLPLAKKLCVQNGGELVLESDKDTGTKVHFRLPITYQEAD